MISIAFSCSSRDAALGFAPHVAQIFAVLQTLPISHVTYGGGHTGLMGCVRAEAEKCGIPVQGYNLTRWHTHADDMVLPTLTLRQAAILDQDVAIFLPGGIGTLYELTQVLCEADTKEQSRAIVLYDPDHYFDPFLQWYETIVTRGIGNPLQCHVVHDPVQLQIFMARCIK